MHPGLEVKGLTKREQYNVYLESDPEGLPWYAGMESNLMCGYDNDNDNDNDVYSWSQVETKEPDRQHGISSYIIVITDFLAFPSKRFASCSSSFCIITTRIYIYTSSSHLQPKRDWNLYERRSMNQVI